MPGSSSLGFVQSSPRLASVVDESHMDDQHHRLPRRSPAPLSISSSLRPEEDVRVPVPRRLLLGWNGAMFLFHSLLAFVTLYVGNRDLMVPIYRTVLEFSFRDEADESAGWDILPVYAPSGTLPLTWLVALFFLLSALFHLLNATLLQAFYLSELERCRTPTRWVEYFLSAPVMIVLIAYGLGQRGRDVLIALFGLVAITMPFGYWTEVEGRPLSQTQWTKPLCRRLYPWFLGHVPQLFAWGLILLQFYEGFAGSDQVPWFVYLILWAELLFFFSFGVGSLVSQLAPPARFYQGELVFQVLSLVSKGVLGLVLITNVLMLSSFDDIYE